MALPMGTLTRLSCSAPEAMASRIPRLRLNAKQTGQSTSQGLGFQKRNLTQSHRGTERTNSPAADRIAKSLSDRGHSRLLLCNVFLSVPLCLCVSFFSRSVGSAFTDKRQIDPAQ